MSTFNGAVGEPSGILKPLSTFVRWGNQGPETGRDLPIVTQYVRVTAIRSQLPHLSKREIDTLVLPGRVPGTELGGRWSRAGRTMEQCRGPQEVPLPSHTFQLSVWLSALSLQLPGLSIALSLSPPHPLLQGGTKCSSQTSSPQ